MRVRSLCTHVYVLKFVFGPSHRCLHHHHQTSDEWWMAHIFITVVRTWFFAIRTVFIWSRYIFSQSLTLSSRYCFLLFVIILPQPFKFMFIYPRLRSTFMLEHSHNFRLVALAWYVHAFKHIAIQVTNNDFSNPSPRHRIASSAYHIRFIFDNEITKIKTSVYNNNITKNRRHCDGCCATPYITEKI